MYLTTLNELNWAYQLHYYICFRTFRRRPTFAADSNAVALRHAIEEICQRHDYHLLKCKPYPDHLRCLLSLRPSHTISDVVRTLKANSSRLLQHNQLWARGFLARSVGKVRVGAVAEYLAQQSEHHGYSERLLPPVFCHTNSPKALSSAHSSFDLNHHLVFSTRFRRGVFTSTVGDALNSYWLRVAAARSFAIDQISVVPDHIHLRVRTVPKISIETCALLLLNNGQHFLSKKCPQLLVQSGLNELWQPSAYAGTCGEINTALVKHWLSVEG